MGNNLYNNNFIIFIYEKKKLDVKILYINKFQ